jgi:hypothetical protein
VSGTAAWEAVVDAGLGVSPHGVEVFAALLVRLVDATPHRDVARIARELREAPAAAMNEASVLLSHLVRDPLPSREGAGLAPAIELGGLRERLR